MAYDKERDIYGIAKDRTVDRSAETIETDIYGFPKRRATKTKRHTTEDTDGLDYVADQPAAESKQPTSQNDAREIAKQTKLGTTAPYGHRRKVAKSEYVFWSIVAVILGACVFFGTLILKEIIPEHQIDFDGVEDFAMLVEDGVEYYSGSLLMDCSLYNPYLPEDIKYTTDLIDDLVCSTATISGRYRSSSIYTVKIEYPEQDASAYLNWRDNKLGRELTAGHTVHNNVIDLDLSDGKITFSKIHTGITENDATNDLNSGNPFVYKFIAYDKNDEIKAVYELSLFLQLDGDSKASLISFHNAANEKRRDMINSGVEPATTPAYDELLANSGVYDGRMLTYTGKVIGILSDGSCEIRENNSGGTILITNCNNNSDSIILNGYTLTVYGQGVGNTTIGGQELPTIYAINKKWSS